MTFYDFILRLATDHEILLIIVICAIYYGLKTPWIVLNRWIRHKNIAAQGWPPAHMDADGDAVSKDDA